MDAGIEHNHAALKRILAALVAMAGLAFPLRAGGNAAGARTLPRHLRLAVLRLLRPAEAAARRLIIALAHGVTLPPARTTARKTKPAPKPMPAILRNGLGTGILMPSRAPQAAAPRSDPAIPASRPLGFPLLDPLRRFGPRRPRPSSVPRICLPGYSEPFPVAVQSPPAPNDPVDATRLTRRLAALARVLDDLPREARRFARWRARRDRAHSHGRVHRVSPLRAGRPFGLQGVGLQRVGLQEANRQGTSRRRAHQAELQEIDEVLTAAHALAVCALERPDTS